VHDGEEKEGGKKKDRNQAGVPVAQGGEAIDGIARQRPPGRPDETPPNRREKGQVPHEARADEVSARTRSHHGQSARRARHAHRRAEVCAALNGRQNQTPSLL
jgi:hypothetical protein